MGGKKKGKERTKEGRRKGEGGRKEGGTLLSGSLSSCLSLLNTYFYCRGLRTGSATEGLYRDRCYINVEIRTIRRRGSKKRNMRIIDKRHRILSVHLLNCLGVQDRHSYRWPLTFDTTFIQESRNSKNSQGCFGQLDYPSGPIYIICLLYEILRSAVAVFTSLVSQSTFGPTHKLCLNILVSFCVWMYLRMDVFIYAFMCVCVNIAAESIFSSQSSILPS